MTRAWLAILCSVALGGCMTLDTRTNPSYDGPPTYSGARVALANTAGAFSQLRLDIMAFFLADSALSAAADTLLLPITIPEQIEWSRSRAKAARLDIEQPSPIQPAAKEPILTTARRLFDLCNGLARNLRPRYTTCYSIEAKIEIQEGDQPAQTLRGEEYKRVILAAMAPMRGTARFVRYEDPVYTAEPPNVRVRATRVDPERIESSEIEMLLGPGEDGGWRILSERSIGWP